MRLSDCSIYFKLAMNQEPRLTQLSILIATEVLFNICAPHPKLMINKEEPLVCGNLTLSLCALQACELGCHFSS